MGGAGDLFEGIGVSAVEPATVGVLDRLEGLRSLLCSASEIGQADIAALVAIDMGVMERESTNRHRCAGEARVLELNQRGKRSIVDNLVTELLVAADEHPNKRAHNAALTMIIGKTHNANDE